MPGYRLPRGGARIDRTRPLRFTFDGATVGGFAGDTIASALIASGRTLVARSFKYHRPRGIYSAGPEEPNALVTLGSGAAEPNSQGDDRRGAGRPARPQPERLAVARLRFQRHQRPLRAVLRGGLLLQDLHGARAARGWMLYEPVHPPRRGSRRGELRARPRPLRDARTPSATCSSSAAGPRVSRRRLRRDAGARVILCEDARRSAARSTSRTGLADERPGRLALRTTVGAERPRQCPPDDAHLRLRLLRRQRARRGRDACARRRRRRGSGTGASRRDSVVLATGAIERPFVFPGNDTPGVMLAGAALAYARRYGVAVGGDVVVFTNNDAGWQRALALSRAGVPVRAVVDPRQQAPANAAAELADTGTECLTGHVVTAARGGTALKSVMVEAFDAADRPCRGRGARSEMRCARRLRRLGAARASREPGRRPAGLFRGDPRLRARRGARALDRGRRDPRHVRCGSRGGRRRARRASKPRKALGFDAVRRRCSGVHLRMRRQPLGNQLPLFEIPGKGKAFVDLQNDVTASDVRLAQREGFEFGRASEALHDARHGGRSGQDLEPERPRHPRQGARAARSPPSARRASARPTIPSASARWSAARAAAISRRSAARRCTTGTSRPAAEMMNVGPWQRPRVYAKDGETLEQAYVREARAVRASVGITDVSTLGKIDVQGPDAATFLDRVYTNTFSTLPVGKARYGLMLRDDGFLYDDGTTWRLADNRYLMTTTTANGALVYQNLEMLLADRLAGAEGLARLAHRPMGGRRGRRAEQPRAACEGARRHRRERCRPALHGREGRASRRVRGARRAALLLRRARLRGLQRLGPRARRLGAAARSRARNSRSCPTGWRRSARCASRRATSPPPRSTGAPASTISGSKRCSR